MADTKQVDAAHDAKDDGDGDITSPSFIGLLLTQFLTATNDNMFRWLVIGIGKDYVPPEDQSWVLTAGLVCFVVPYLALAPFAGYLADRFSKRNVVIACKIAEIIIMTLGVISIMFGNLYYLLAIVAAMGAQSALFSPSKMGLIPELLRANRISAANGLFNMSTVAATIIGMGLGNFLADATSPYGKENWWWTAIALIGTAVIGTVLSFLIRHTRVGNPNRPFPWNGPLQVIRDFQMLFADGSLIRVALGVTFFWSIGALAQLNIDQYVQEGGALLQTDNLPLLISLVAGLGVGAVSAGVLSRGRVELGILPIGAAGMVVFSILLFTVSGPIVDPPTRLTWGMIFGSLFLFCLGGSAGLFSVPLDSWMQYRSPREKRGSILAATNFLTFAGVIGAGVMFNLMRMPTTDGSLANIDPHYYTSTEVSPADAAAIDALQAEYAEHWSETNQSDLAAFYEQEPKSAPLRGLASLLWVEFRELKARDMFIDKHSYMQMFENGDNVREQTIVKHVYEQSGKLPLLTARQVFLAAGLLTIPVFFYIVWKIPYASLRFIVWMLSGFAYRIRLYGDEKLPETGGALIVSNHVSWLDAILILMISPRPVRMLAWSGNFEKGFMSWLAKVWGIILIPSRPKAMVKALRTAQEALTNGDLVCIFPEGGITRSNQIQGFKPGMLRIIENTGAPVIPLYLDELWGSVFSYEGGKFFWKVPKRWPYPISIFVGDPIEHPEDVNAVRRAVQDLGALALESRKERTIVPARSFIRRCQEAGGKLKIADSTGTEFSGRMLLLRTLVARRLFKRHVLADNEKNVGVLMPPSAAGAVVNAALALDRRVVINLNFTVSSKIMNSCLAQAGVKHVLTSRKFMEKLKERFEMDIDAELIYLEDLIVKPTLFDKAIAAMQAYVMPTRMLERGLRLHKVKHDDVMSIIFTSGSTGEPKGVMLTMANIASNVEAVDHVIKLTKDDTLLGVLPFFHSLGYTISLWGVLGLNIRGAYHPNPTEAKQVGKLCERYEGTLLLSTPTFLRSYLRRCTKEQFASLDVVVAGAEKLPTDLCDAFEEKFGVRPVEGYGTTELSPLVSVNIPPSRSQDNFQIDSKEGTVGRPIPGVAAKTLNLETDQENAAEVEGMLWIKGPNVMKGYLNRDDLTSEVVHDGWYKTGDVALVDSDGFIKITGRVSRFSKIGGEMVPHLLVEEKLAKLIGAQDEVKVAVTSVPHAKKGEQLVVVHTELTQTPEELCKSLADEGLPNIYIPSTRNFMQVDEIPVLGTGKLDLAEVKNVAIQKYGEESDDE